MNVFFLQRAAAKASALTSRGSLPSSSKAFITQRQMLRKQFLSTDRKQGYEALSELEPKKKMANYATAAACAAFVTGVWYYSVSAVGRGDGELEELEKAAAQKITVHQSGFKPPVGIQNPASSDEVVVAVSAPADIAEEEENASLRVGDKASNLGTGTSQNTGWKRYVFFWRK